LVSAWLFSNLLKMLSGNPAEFYYGVWMWVPVFFYFKP